jgi:hypothetical protein
VDYLLGVSPNSAVRRAAAAALALATSVAAGRADGQARSYDTATYQSETWRRAHRIVLKAERTKASTDIRCVVTTLGTLPPRETYGLYAGRGDAENRIKDFKRGLMADRLSCHLYLANAFRLQLHAGAYELLYGVARAGADFGHRDAHRTTGRTGGSGPLGAGGDGTGAPALAVPVRQGHRGARDDGARTAPRVPHAPESDCSRSQPRSDGARVGSGSRCRSPSRARPSFGGYSRGSTRASCSSRRRGSAPNSQQQSPLIGSRTSGRAMRWRVPRRGGRDSRCA